MNCETVWGVGELRVKVAESGELIRFNYRAAPTDLRSLAALSELAEARKKGIALAGVDQMLLLRNKVEVNPELGPSAFAKPAA